MRTFKMVTDFVPWDFYFCFVLLLNDETNRVGFYPVYTMQNLIQRRPTPVAFLSIQNDMRKLTD